MEDGAHLDEEDKIKIGLLKSELATLKAAHKKWASKKNGLSPEEREMWRLNSQRTNEIYIEIKDLRFKNILEAGKGK